MAASPRAVATRRPHLAERVVLVVAIVLGLAWIAWMGYLTALSLKQKFVDGIYWIELGVSGTELDPPTAGPATVTQVWTGPAGAYITDLSPETTALVVTQHILGFALWALVIGAGVFLCIRVLRGRPFAVSMTVTLWVAAGALILVGSALDIMSSALSNALTLEALGPGRPPEPYTGGSGFNFPGGYLLAGLGVAAIAVAFRSGARISRDTDGLV